MEVVDMVEALIGKRNNAEAVRKARVTQAQAELQSAKENHMSLLQSQTTQAQTSQQSGALQIRYQQMCQWNMDSLEQRRHREECEKDAIHAALIILSAR